MYKIFFNAFIILIVVACGKKISPEKKSTSNNNTERRPLSSSLQKFIQKQTVFCEDENSCNESVAKIVVIERESIRYCTATLISEDMMVTSSSCLPPTLRVPGLDCSKSIYAIFPKNQKDSIKRIACSKIIFSDSNDIIDPALWRSDFTFFSLEKKMQRQVINFSREGLLNGKKYKTWKVQYETDTDAVIKRTDCMPILNSYANPFADKESSPMIPVSGCSSMESNGGAPLLNELGELVGIFSEKLSRDLVYYISMSNLLSEPILPMHFVANISCARIPSKHNILDKECFKEMSSSGLDKLRSSMLTSSELHEKNMQNVIHEIDGASKYFKWEMKFYQNNRNNNWQVHIQEPKCFYDINSWVDEFTRIGGFIRSYVELDFEFKNYEVKTKLNRFLRPVSIVEQNGNKKYKLIFNPKSAFNEKFTYLNIFSTLFDRDINSKFEKVTDNCN